MRWAEARGGSTRTRPIEVRATSPGPPLPIRDLPAIPRPCLPVDAATQAKPFRPFVPLNECFASTAPRPRAGNNPGSDGSPVLRGPWVAMQHPQLQVAGPPPARPGQNAATVRCSPNRQAPRPAFSTPAQWSCRMPCCCQVVPAPSAPAPGARARFPPPADEWKRPSALPGPGWKGPVRGFGAAVNRKVCVHRPTWRSPKTEAHGVEQPLLPHRPPPAKPGPSMDPGPPPTDLPVRVPAPESPVRTGPPAISYTVPPIGRSLCVSCLLSSLGFQQLLR